MTTISWRDVWIIQNGKGDKVHLPSIEELDSTKEFILTEVEISEIDLTFVSSLEEFKVYGCIKVQEAVEALMDLYTNREFVPPIVLDKNKEIIDGIHRISAQIELNFTKISAFIEV